MLTDAGIALWFDSRCSAVSALISEPIRLSGTQTTVSLDSSRVAAARSAPGDSPRIDRRAALLERSAGFTAKNSQSQHAEVREGPSVRLEPSRGDDDAIFVDESLKLEGMRRRRRRPRPPNILLNVYKNISKKYYPPILRARRIADCNERALTDSQSRGSFMALGTKERERAPALGTVKEMRRFFIALDATTPPHTASSPGPQTFAAPRQRESTSTSASASGVCHQTY